MKSLAYREKALTKLAYGPFASTWGPTVGVDHPQPNVGNVLDWIGVAQARGIGTQQQRTDAFGKIINSGLVNTSPAGNALRMLGGGILGRAITSAFTKNPFVRGLGTGIGAVSAMSNY